MPVEKVENRNVYCDKMTSKFQFLRHTNLKNTNFQTNLPIYLFKGLLNKIEHFPFYIMVLKVSL